jgi:hypothetical protein
MDTSQSVGGKAGHKWRAQLLTRSRVFANQTQLEGREGVSGEYVPKGSRIF